MRTKLTIPDTVDAPWMRQARRNFHTPNVGFSSPLPLPHQGALSAGTTPLQFPAAAPLAASPIHKRRPRHPERVVVSPYPNYIFLLLWNEGI
jgi:hypothetical protein